MTAAGTPNRMVFFRVAIRLLEDALVGLASALAMQTVLEFRLDDYLRSWMRSVGSHGLADQARSRAFVLCSHRLVTSGTKTIESPWDYSHPGGGRNRYAKAGRSSITERRIERQVHTETNLEGDTTS